MLLREMFRSRCSIHAISRPKKFSKPFLLRYCFSNLPFDGTADNKGQVQLPWEHWDFYKKDGSFDETEEYGTVTDDIWNGLSNEQLDQSLKILSGQLSDSGRQVRLGKMQNVLANRSKRFRFAFEDISNLNNIWASLRTLDSFGIQFADIIFNLEKSKSLERGQTMSSALGTQKWLSLDTYHSPDACVTNARKLGYKVIATSLCEESQSVFDIDWLSSPALIIFGNEERGISDVTRKLSDSTLHIPMKGFAQSLNIAASCAGNGAFHICTIIYKLYQ